MMLAILFVIFFAAGVALGTPVHDKIGGMIEYSPNELSFTTGDTSIDGVPSTGMMSSKQLVYSIEATLNDTIVYPSDFMLRLIMSTCNPGTVFDTFLTVVDAQDNDTVDAVNLTDPVVLRVDDNDYICVELPMTTKAALSLVDRTFDATSLENAELIFVIVQGYDTSEGEFAMTVTSCGASCLEFVPGSTCACSMCAAGFVVQEDGSCKLKRCLGHMSGAPLCVVDYGYTADDVAWDFETGTWTGSVLADCGGATPVCASLNRDECQLPFTCGPCLPGYVLDVGEMQNNTFCNSTCFDPQCGVCRDSREGSCEVCTESILYDGACIEGCPALEEADWQNPGLAQLLYTDSVGEDNDGFGTATSVFGRTALVGAWHKPEHNRTDNHYYGTTGHAYIFEETFAGSGNWKQIAELIPTNVSFVDMCENLYAEGCTLYNGFGTAVSIANGIAAVGMPQYFGDRGYNHGAVYIFSENISPWRGEVTASAIITPDDEFTSLYGFRAFGCRVSVLDQIVVVATTSTFIFLFQESFRDSTVWTQIGTYVTAKYYCGTCLGNHLVWTGKEIFAGTYNYGASKKGVVHVLQQSGSGNWNKTELRPLVSRDYDYFGSSLSISNRTAIIGQMSKSFRNAFIFQKGFDKVNEWSQAAELHPVYPAGTQSDYKTFGKDVSVWGQTAVVTGSFLDSNDVSTSALFVYEESSFGSGEWPQISCITVPVSSTFNTALFGQIALVADVDAVSKYPAYVGTAYVLQVDCIAPVFTVCPSDITTVSSVNTPLDLNVSAVDNMDPNPIITCNHALNMTFVTGSTTVISCNATDKSLNVDVAGCVFSVNIEGPETNVSVSCPSEPVSIDIHDFHLTSDLVVIDSTYPDYTVVAFNASSVNSTHSLVTGVASFGNVSDSCLFWILSANCSWLTPTQLSCPPAIEPRTLRSTDDAMRAISGTAMGKSLGSVVTFEGVNFNMTGDDTVLSVTFKNDDMEQEVCSLIRASATELTCVMPPTPTEWSGVQYLHFRVIVVSAALDVELESAFSVDTFHYPVTPTLTSVSGCHDASDIATSDCTTIDQNVTIVGKEFSLATKVEVDSKNCTSLHLVSDSEITCTLPEGSGTNRAVAVFQSDLSSERLSLVSYIAPTVLSVQALNGCSNKDDVSAIDCPTTEVDNITLVLQGANFGPQGATVYIGSHKAENVKHGKDEKAHTELTCDLPRGYGQDIAVLVLQENGLMGIPSEATVSYQGCDAGYYESGEDCLPCPHGTFTSDDTVKSACVPCGAGTVQPNTGKSSCAECEAGKYQGEPGKATCKDCEAGGYSNNNTVKYFCSTCSKTQHAPYSGMADCIDCPDNAHRDEESVAGCLCNEGYYNTTRQTGGEASPESVCELCPDHFSCPETGMDVTMLILEAGYWRSDEYSMDVFTCFSTESCPGGTFTETDQDMCAEHRTGELCTLCETGYAASSITKPCEACINSTVQIVVFVCAGLLGVLFCVWTVRETLREANYEASNATTLGKILFSAFQVISISGAFSFSWDDVFTVFTAAQSSASSFGAATLDLSCVLETHDTSGLASVYVETFFFSLTGLYVVVLPLMIVVPYYRYTIARSVPWSSVFREISGSLFVAIPIVLFLLHPTLCTEAMNLYHCTAVGNTLRLSAQLDQDCWEKPHVYWAIFAGIPMIVLYVFGIPLSGAFVLYRNKEKVRTNHPDHNAFHAKYSFLYKGYAVDDPSKGSYVYLWEIVVSARKVLLLTVLVFFDQDPHMQSLLGLLVISVALVLHTRALPFNSSLLNLAEFLSLFCSVVTFYLGQFTYTDNVSDSTRLLVSWMALIINVAFLVFMLYHIITSFRKERKLKKQRLNSYSTAEEMLRASLLDLQQDSDRQSDLDDVVL